MGSGYDSPESKDILSHAHAFSTNPNVRLVGIIDVDRKRGEYEATRWKTALYPNLLSLAKTALPDIIVIATPDPTHVEMLEEALALKPKLIVCEKPLAANETDAERIRNLLSKTSVPVIVNFTRRYDTAMVRLQKVLVRKGATSVHARYGKGTHHIGSHLFDLLRFFFGELVAAQADVTIDDYPGDPTFGGSASFEHCPAVSIEAVDSRENAVFELAITAKTHRYLILEGGYMLETRDKTGTIHREATKLSQALPELVHHCIRVIEGREEPRTPASDALKTFNACERFAQSYRAL